MSETNRWGTPREWVEMARAALGGFIQLDPMSEPAFNSTVGAYTYFTEADGLCWSSPWMCSTMLINPAGGHVLAAWRKLVSEFNQNHIGRAIWFGFSVEQLNLLADEMYHPHDFALLTCRKRISFVRHDGFVGSPGHANYVVGLGVPKGEFERAFAGRGRFDYGRFAQPNEAEFGLVL